jgi:hypothetical protein
MAIIKDKLPLQLVPLIGIVAVAEVYEFGCGKYGPDNWRGPTPKAQTANDHKGAILRHLARMELGELVDSETGIRHEQHIAARALMWAAQVKLGTDVDNQFRYKVEDK